MFVKREAEWLPSLLYIQLSLVIPTLHIFSTGLSTTALPPRGPESTLNSYRYV